MKILLAHSDPKLPARESIDLWRIIRPFAELEKHVDWQIDHVPYLVPEELFDDQSRVKIDDLLTHLETIADYDVIWTSYFPDAMLFDALQFMCERSGTKFVLDCDDDMYHIPAHNGIWKSAGATGVQSLQWMVQNAPNLVTSCPNLKAEFEKHRKAPTYILPNYIGADYKHKPFNNGDKVVIGFFGSVTHKHDLFNTGFIEALQQLMNKYVHVHVGTVGLAIDAYLPKGRYTHYPGKPGRAWLTEVWPNINVDIAVAPLEDTPFNRAKTNIKWLETAMIPAAFVGSNIPPYQGTVEHDKTGLLTDNSSEGWYEALESLVINPERRIKLAANARKEVLAKWNIATGWETLKTVVEQINGA
jgi:glycosyltransferase involved in cell wall biosynthesis